MEFGDVIIEFGDVIMEFGDVIMLFGEVRRLGKRGEVGAVLCGDIEGGCS